MRTMSRTAKNPETGSDYRIEMPAPKAVREAILKLEWPDAGLTVKEAAEKLAEQFGLSEEQKNAVNISGLNLFRYDVVAPIFRNLLEKRGIEQPAGARTPYFLVDETPLFLVAKTGLEEIIARIEKNYEEFQSELGNNLLERIKANTPAFFEKLVINLLVEMGYGGSLEDAQTVGQSGDGGIDGIIKQDTLGLDIIYVQAKRWGDKVGEPEIRDFVGALAAQHAQKGIFITTSEFRKTAQKYVNTIAQKVILIDGEQLVELMIKHNVGVSTQGNYEIKRIDLEYFPN